MKKDRLKYLLEKYSDESLSSSEYEELVNWYNQINYGTGDVNQWISDSGGEEIVVQRLYEDFERKIRKPSKIIPLSIIKLISIAAMLVLAVASGFYFYKSYSVNRKKIELKAAVSIKPGGDKAVLTLSNGKHINLGQVANGQILATGDLQIKKVMDGRVDYSNIPSQNSSVEINTITTPNGGKYQVVLADGTHVWLNASSSLKYPTSFSGAQRKVELSGEAYFEVTHNNKKPFIVITNNQTVKVLGTHFNINAYQDDFSAKTTLLEGSVMVSAITNKDSRILKPGEQATFQNNTMTVQNADIDGVMAWKNGYFMFDDENVYSIMKKVSRWYDVDIVYKDTFTNKRFGGYVSRSKNITELLNVLEITKGIHFKIEGRTVFVMK